MAGCTRCNPQWTSSARAALPSPPFAIMIQPAFIPRRRLAALASRPSRMLSARLTPLRSLRATPSAVHSALVEPQGGRYARRAGRSRRRVQTMMMTATLMTTLLPVGGGYATGGQRASRRRLIGFPPRMRWSARTTLTPGAQTWLLARRQHSLWFIATGGRWLLTRRLSGCAGHSLKCVLRSCRCSRSGCVRFSPRAPATTHARSFSSLSGWQPGLGEDLGWTRTAMRTRGGQAAAPHRGRRGNGPNGAAERRARRSGLQLVEPVAATMATPVAHVGVLPNRSGRHARSGPTRRAYTTTTSACDGRL